MDLGTSCRPWPLECVCWAWCCGSAGPVSPLFFSFVCPPDSFLVSFVLPLGLVFVVFFGLFKPIVSAGMGGRRWCIRGYPEAALPLFILWRISFIVLFFLLLQLGAGS